jgi:hypothetical protein
MMNYLWYMSERTLGILLCVLLLGPMILAGAGMARASKYIFLPFALVPSALFIAVSTSTVWHGYAEPAYFMYSLFFSFIYTLVGLVLTFFARSERKRVWLLPAVSTVLASIPILYMFLAIIITTAAHIF